LTALNAARALIARAGEAAADAAAAEATARDRDNIVRVGARESARCGCL